MIMSRAIWCLFCFSLLVAHAPHASASPRSGEQQSARFGIGARTGPGITWWAGQDASSEQAEASSKVGFHVTAFATADLATWFSIQPEFMFVTKGVNQELVQASGAGHISISYLEIPVLGRLMYRYQSLEPYLVAGPALGLLIACRDELDGDVGDCRDTSKTFDPGIVLGAGIAIRLPWEGALILDVRYDMSLVSRSSRTPELDLRNRAVLFSIGYSHRLSGADPH